MAFFIILLGFGDQALKNEPSEKSGKLISRKVAKVRNTLKIKLTRLCVFA
jgi:hypothetical protein